MNSLAESKVSFDVRLLFVTCGVAIRSLPYSLLRTSTGCAHARGTPARHAPGGALGLSRIPPARTCIRRRSEAQHPPGTRRPQPIVAAPAEALSSRPLPRSAVCTVLTPPPRGGSSWVAALPDLSLCVAPVATAAPQPPPPLALCTATSGTDRTTYRTRFPSDTRRPGAASTPGALAPPSFPPNTAAPTPTAARLVSGSLPAPTMREPVAPTARSTLATHSQHLCLTLLPIKPVVSSHRYLRPTAT